MSGSESENFRCEQHTSLAELIILLIIFKSNHLMTVPISVELLSTTCPLRSMSSAAPMRWVVECDTPVSVPAFL